MPIKAPRPFGLESLTRSGEWLPVRVSGESPLPFDRETREVRFETREQAERARWQAAHAYGVEVRVVDTPLFALERSRGKAPEVFERVRARKGLDNRMADPASLELRFISGSSATREVSYLSKIAGDTFRVVRVGPSGESLEPLVVWPTR